jgi:hypothetical protein
MVTEDQTATIEVLSRSSTHGGATVDRIDGHQRLLIAPPPMAKRPSAMFRARELVRSNRGAGAPPERPFQGRA